MLKNFFSKGVVGLLTFIFVFSAVVYPNTSYAQTVDEEKLNQLSKDLIIAGEFIMTSKTVSDEERLVLMSQLIAVSNAILTLKKSIRGSILVEEEVDESDRVSAKEAKLKRVILSYDAPINVAKVKITTSTTTIDKEYQLASVSLISGYDARLTLLKKEIVKELSNYTNVLAKDIEDLMFLTSRNPNRSNYIIQNSRAANNALKAFGKESIVNKIIVSPGMKYGSITFISDQDESMVISLLKEFRDLRNGDREELTTYQYSYAFYASTDQDRIVDTEYDDEGRPYFIKKPKIFSDAYEVNKEDIIKRIVDLFNKIPFTSRVPKFEEKTLKFLTENPTSLTYYQSSDLEKSSTSDCYYASDKAVMIDFLKYLAEGSEVQIEFRDFEKLVSLAPQYVLFTDRYIEPKCEIRSRFF